MKKIVLLSILSIFVISCNKEKKEEKKSSKKQVVESVSLPKIIKIEGIALNPEGIEFNKNDNTFLLSSLNATPITKVKLDGSYKPFTGGEKFPLSTAGIQIDYKNNRLLAAGFNGTELMDGDPKTKGTAFLRVYNLKTGMIEKDINLSSLAPNANAYFANDIAIDNNGNAYISDWYAGLIYKVDSNGNPSIFWKNKTEIKGGPNGLDFHPDGYLLVSLLNVNKKGLYSDYGLVKIPVNNPMETKVVTISDTKFTGFDGMIFNKKGNIVGVTNNGKTPGGNVLIELNSKNNWNTAQVINNKDIKPSTTVAIAPNSKYFVINQDFSNNMAKTWTIEQIEF